MKHTILFAFVTALVALSAGTAKAQDPAAEAANGDEAINAAIEAKKRYAAGQKSLAQRQFVEAALHFEAAHAFSPSGVALISAAISWESANLPQRAADAYARALDEPGLRKAQTAHARARLEALERSLATLVLTGDDGIRVQLDDNVVVLLPARLHGNPGSHRLLVWSKGKVSRSRDIFMRLAQPESMVVPSNDEVPVPAPLVLPPSPAEPVVQPVTDIWKVLGGGLLGAGGVTFVAGTFLQVASANGRSASARATTPEAASVLRSNAQDAQTYGIAAWIATGVLATSGLTLVLWPRRSAKVSAAVSPTVGGACVHGSF